MSTHAKLSPSSSKRWMNCPGSVRLISALNIEDKPNVHAAEGTAAHWIHEQCLLHNYDANHFANALIGVTEDGDAEIATPPNTDKYAFTFTATEEMIEAVQTSLDYVRGCIAEGQAQGYEVDLYVEVWAALDYLLIDGLDGGTSDVVLVCRDGDRIVWIEVIDYKHGKGVLVEAEHNTQELCYALGSVLSLLSNYTIDLDTSIILTIAQPRAFHPDGQIRSWEITARDLYRWEREELIPAAEATIRPDAPLIPGDDQCRWCDAAPCVAQQEKLNEIAILDFEDCADTLPTPEKLTADQKILIVQNASMLREFISKVEQSVYNEIDHGSSDYENHFKLVKKRSNRKYNDDAFDREWSPIFDYLKEEEVFAETPKTLTEVEKLLKARIGASKAKKVMGEITTKPEGGTVIAPIDDNRQPVNPSVINDFDGLED